MYWTETVPTYSMLIACALSPLTFINVIFTTEYYRTDLEGGSGLLMTAILDAEWMTVL